MSRGNVSAGNAREMTSRELRRRWRGKGKGKGKARERGRIRGFSDKGEELAGNETIMLG